MTDSRTFRYGGDGSGGGGLALRRPVDVFTGADTATAEAARDTYFQTTNAAALDEFTQNLNLAIIIRVTGSSDAFQTFIGAEGDTYDADNWVDRTDAVQGLTGDAGGDGARGSLWAQGDSVPTDTIFETLAGVAPRQGDHYLRRTTDRVYTRGADADSWVQGANLTGGRGASGNDGDDGQGVYAGFSVDGSADWHETPTANDLYIRFATGTTRPSEVSSNWGVAIRFVGEDGADGSGNGMGGSGQDGEDGEDGADGQSVYASFSQDGSTSWHETPTSDDTNIRFATGTARPSEDSSDWGTAIQFVGTDGTDGTNGTDGTDGTDGTNGNDGASVEIEFSSDNSNWHAAIVAADTYIRFRVGSGSWQARQFVGPMGPSGRRGSRWFSTSSTSPQAQTGELEGDFQIINDAQVSVYRRGTSAWEDTNLNLRGPAGSDGAGGGTQVAANPAGSDGDDLTRIAIGGTNYNIAGGTGGGGGGDVELTLIGTRYTFATAGDTRWYATGISPGTIEDDELLYVRFSLLGEPARYRPMRGSTFNGLPENTAGAALSSSQSGLWQTKDAVNFSNLFASVTSAGELLVASDSDWESDDYVELYKLEATGGGSGGSGGNGETPDASEIDADLDDDPPQGGTVKAWLEWLAGENAIGETARTQLRTRLDSLEHTAVRAAVDDWQDVTDHLSQYGNAGLLVSTNDWTTVDAAAVIWQSSPTIQAAGTYRVIAQLPAEFDVDRFRTQWDITGNGAYNFAIPNASNRWAEFTGTVENADPFAKYYILVDIATGATQYRASMPQDGSVNLQHNDGTPASAGQLTGVPDGGNDGQVLTKASGTDGDVGWEDAASGLPSGGTNGQVLTKASSTDGDAGWEDATGGTEVTANPDGSDGDDLTRISIGGTNYVIPSGGGSGSPLELIGENLTGFKTAGSDDLTTDPPTKTVFSGLATGITIPSGADEALLIAADAFDEAGNNIGGPAFQLISSADLLALPPQTATTNLTTVGRSLALLAFAATTQYRYLVSRTAANELLFAYPAHRRTITNIRLYRLTGGGGAAAGETITISVGDATDAAATTLLHEESIEVTLGQTFNWRPPRIDRNTYRVIRMPAATNELVSIIGEGGETIEGWAKQSDNVTWSTGPVANNARDPETFTVRVT